MLLISIPQPSQSLATIRPRAPHPPWNIPHSSGWPPPNVATYRTSQGVVPLIPCPMAEARLSPPTHTTAFPQLLLSVTARGEPAILQLLYLLTQSLSPAPSRGFPPSRYPSCSSRFRFSRFWLPRSWVLSLRYVWTPPALLLLAACSASFAMANPPISSPSIANC